ncbi:MAG TPA: hypothetical protein VFF10_10945 [Trueperaceae bacterium]|nr:hypothetical protein [Trueperaceae bacterium]
MFTKTTGVAPKRLAVLLLFSLGAAALAHVTKTAGDGDYELVVGFIGAPLYVDEIEQVELIARDSSGEAVVGLESSLRAQILGPDGAVLEVTLRTVHGTPGLYLADFRPTQVGNYDVRLYGFVGEFEFDEVYSGVAISHSDPVVSDPETISIP